MADDDEGSGIMGIIIFIAIFGVGNVILYLTNMVSDMDRIQAGGVHFSYDSKAPIYIGVLRRGGDGQSQQDQRGGAQLQRLK